jgi:hypothetical protein
VWDRAFGTFQPERHRPTYGLPTPVNTYNLVTLARPARLRHPAPHWRPSPT